MFRTVPLSIIRSLSLYTQQWYMSYSLRAGSGRMRPDPAGKLSTNLYDIYHCCVYSEKLLSRRVPLSIIRSFSLYTQEQGGTSSVLILLESCMTYTIAVCTVENC